ncbi:AsnC family transcriptional regulator [Methylobacterium aerolatum]|uniref:AsnC family transcriptional regulator n=1 Tax=Methylobacterium aerolatum TaxID=418708 RepID=A0ABU0HU46_9HYPH|nr:AsnC family transcriptional regulator [Methylobacterium aerolatum]MDQ0445851.1 hypothetical protein [Methylobacterium aerolatum]GJD35888.1 hypothetical protein FMGBMHLM_2801 [Methylobacterium aerolatum]
MHFEFTRRRSNRSPVTDAPTFRVGRLASAGHTDRDMSHLIDRSYNYHSPRELHWHLADRLGVAPSTVSVRESRLA